MNKEYLEALKTIKIKCHPNSNPSPTVDEALGVIEQALQRLEAIDNANPSEALERTSSEFIDGYPTGNVNVGMTWEEHSAIKQALLKAQKDKIIADFIREHYKLSDDINENYLVLKKPITEEEHIKFKENL